MSRHTHSISLEGDDPVQLGWQENLPKERNIRNSTIPVELDCQNLYDCMQHKLERNRYEPSSKRILMRVKSCII